MACSFLCTLIALSYIALRCWQRLTAASLSVTKPESERIQPRCLPVPSPLTLTPPLLQPFARQTGPLCQGLVDSRPQVTVCPQRSVNVQMGRPCSSVSAAHLIVAGIVQALLSEMVKGEKRVTVDATQGDAIQGERASLVYGYAVLTAHGRTHALIFSFSLSPNPSTLAGGVIR